MPKSISARPFPTSLRWCSESALFLQQSLHPLDLGERDRRRLAGDLQVFELTGSHPVVDAHSGHAKEICGHRLVYDAVCRYAPFVPLASDPAANRNAAKEAGRVPLDLDAVF